MVSQRHRLQLFFGALAFALSLCTIARSADETCVVVLRSGGVLQGAVTLQGDRYAVAAPNRTIDVQAQQVLLIAPSMQAAYEHQRAQLSRDNNDARLRLAEWCLRYDLLTQAEQELADARQLDQFDPRLPLLDRRLAVAKKPKTTRSVYQTAIAVDDSKSEAELDELELVAAELPPGAFERFTRKVQPLLVNSCTASGCHESGGKQEFQLDRAVLHGLANRRITLRNLAATLAYVDRLSPQQSELLKMARRNHGGREHATLNPRQVAQLKQLGDWTEHLAGTTHQPAPFQEPLVASKTVDSPPISHPLPGIPRAVLDSQVQRAGHVEAEETLRPKAKVQFGAQLKKWEPDDEFDPEIFNRAQNRAQAADDSAPQTVDPSDN